MIINLCLVAVMLVVAGSLWWRGLWNAGVSFLSVLAAGTVASAWYESFAGWLDQQMPDYHHFLDFVAFWSIFSGVVGLLLAVTLGLNAASQVRFPKLAERIGAPLLGIMTGWVTAEVIAFSLHLAPVRVDAVPLPPDASMLWGLAPDRCWLSWTRGSTANGPFAVPERRFDPSDDFIKRYATRREILASEMTIFSPGR
jgi:uncharacterized membrane protein required for colicin V production